MAPVLLRVTKTAQQNWRQNPGERREGGPLVRIRSEGNMGGNRTFAALCSDGCSADFAAIRCGRTFSVAVEKTF